MILAKMDLYKYRNVYMYFSSWLLVPIPQQVAWSVAMTVYTIFERRCEKPGLRGFRPGPIQTRLYSYRRWLEA